MAADEAWAALAGARTPRALVEARARFAFVLDAVRGRATVVAGPRAGALGLALAEAGVEVTILEPSEERRAALALEAALAGPEVAARLHTDQPADQPAPARAPDDAPLDPTSAAPAGFAAAVWAAGEPDLGAAAAGALSRHLALGGRLVVLAPFEAACPPRALVEPLARGLWIEALSVHGGFVALLAARGERCGVADRVSTALLAVTEAAAAAALARAAEVSEGLARDRRSLLARSSAEVRASAAALRAAHEQNVRLKSAVERTRRSARYRLGALVLGAARPSKDTLKLPAKLLEIYRDKTEGEGERARAASEDPARRTFDERLDDFVRHVRRERPRHVVVMYTGTSIAGLRGNRPWLMTKVLRARGVPVIFGYAGSAASGEPPPATEPGLLELPVDVLAARLPELASADLGGARRVFVLSFPTAAAAPLVGRLGACGWATVYDALDDWEEFARADVASWWSSGVERFVLAASDVATAVSAPLAAKLEALGGRAVELSPNAYDPAFLAPGHVARPSPAIKIGYFGHLTPAWFDWATLRTVARARPSSTFEIIGHGAPAGLELPQNVQLLGPKPPHEICTYAAEWRAAIIPFRVGPLADAVDPIKVYEYLALHLPVVSLRMPQIAAYPYVTTVTGADAFVRALDEALAVRVDPATVARFLDANTWARRVDGLLAAADRVLAAPGFEKQLHGGAP